MTQATSVRGEPTNSHKIPLRTLLDTNNLFFYAVHLACLGAIWTGVSLFDIALCLGAYLVRVWGITGGFHRYFSHRGYRTSRVFQFILAFIGGAAAQKGALWWASIHRRHHRYADTEQDAHSPWYGGFFQSHMGWVMSGNFQETNEKIISDFARYPELRWLDKHFYVPPTLLGVAMFLIGGWSGLVWGFFVSTVLLYHATFSINSVMHRFGRKRYRTDDTSRNNWFFALLTLGEGWHNNHHYFPSSARNGFYWWEFDVTYYVLKVLSWFGIVWDLKEVPEEVRESNHYEVNEPKLWRVDERGLGILYSRDALRASDVAAKYSLQAKEAALSVQSARADGAEDVLGKTTEAMHRYAETARRSAQEAAEAASLAMQRAKTAANEALETLAEAANEAARRAREAAGEAAAAVSETLATLNAQTQLQPQLAHS